MSDKNSLFVLRREAGGEPFEFKVGAKTLKVPHINSVDQFELAELFASDHTSDLAFVTDLFKLCLGDSFESLRALHLTRPELMALHQAYTAHCGTDTGESAASSD